MTTRERMDRIIQKILRSSIFSWWLRKEIKIRMKLGFDINGQIDGRGPQVPLLHLAAFGKSYKVCKFLLENGAQVNFEFDTKREIGHVLPIHCAIQQNSPKILKLLLDYGANLDGLTRDCSDVEKHVNPLENALYFNLSHIVKILIDNEVTYSKIFYWSVANNIRNEFDILVENGANVNLPENNDGDTLLHVALKSNKRPKEIVEKLIRHGAHLNVKDWAGNTPMETALQYRDVEMVKICLLKDY